jgi:hypothetical protein
MKSFRFLLALTLAVFLTTAFVRAADDKAKTEEKTCDCAKDKDGKVCGKDKDCCCTGQKCDREQKTDEKKPEKK